LLKIKRQKSFIKDLSKIKMSDNHFTKYISYIVKLLNNEPLPPEAKDHHLYGKWDNAREFHISGDLLVIYFIIDNELILIRIGSHSQLFE
jgi:mRNA interferase YafQ